jgi:hypothetical protein
MYGKIRPPYSNTYTFTYYYDDRFRIYINDNLIGDGWNTGWGSRSDSIYMTANTFYNIKLEWSEGGGGAHWYLYWNSANLGSMRIVESSYLYSIKRVGSVVNTVEVQNPPNAASCYFTSKPTTHTAGDVYWNYMQTRDSSNNSIDYTTASYSIVFSGSQTLTTTAGYYSSAGVYRA